MWILFSLFSLRHLLGGQLEVSIVVVSKTDAAVEISNLTREPANQGDRERAQNLYVWRIHFVLQILPDTL
jgi:hypothetical protein